ncbi:MAG: DUF1698 domain-containing protein [Cucumibacter sp.]
MLGGGVTPGVMKLDRLQDIATRVFKYPVAGKTVLDIGAWDGFFSFEAERLGAADVLSTDSFCWGGPGWGTKAGFNFAHRARKSRIRSHEVDLYEMDPARLGQFDVVLFLGVLYHLTDPLGGLKRAAALARNHIVVETVTNQNDAPFPAMQYAPGFRDDATNFWIPNVACVEAMLRTFGFSQFDILLNPTTQGFERHIFHAWRQGNVTT